MEAHSADRGILSLWWLGQSGYLLQWNGKRILIDPYLSDSLTHKYAHSDKPHIRMSERVVSPEALMGIHLVTSSHNHTDHLDAETLLPVLANNPGASFIIPEANRNFVAERLQMNGAWLMGLNDNETGWAQGIAVTAVPASHNELERDERGCCRYLGYIFQLGPWKIYHSGDTLWYPGMEDLLQPFRVHVALLPINGNHPARGVAGNLSGAEAARLAKKIGASMLIPCHYDMFTFNTADPHEMAREADSIGQPYCILGGGQRYELSIHS